MFKEQQASTKHRVMKKQRLSPHKPFCVQKPCFGWSKNPPPSDNCVLFTWKYLLWHFSSMCGVAAIPCFHPFSVLAESLSCVFFFTSSLISRVFFYILTCFLAHDGMIVVRNNKWWNAKLGKFSHVPNSTGGLCIFFWYLVFISGTFFANSWSWIWRWLSPWGVWTALLKESRIFTSNGLCDLLVLVGWEDSKKLFWREGHAIMWRSEIWNRSE